MLMMRAGLRPLASASPADAHDALAGGLCPKSQPADAHDARWLAASAPLMLMMRAGWRPMPRASPADAHDARWLAAFAKSQSH